MNRTLVLVAHLAAATAGAEMLPSWTVHHMCGEADAIVVAERVGANKARVLEWLFRSEAGDGEAPHEIVIDQLDTHERGVTEGIVAKPKQALTSQRFACFLDDDGGRWRAMGTAGVGSSGLIWIQEGRCYRYHQRVNPGPYALSLDRQNESELELRKGIEASLGDRRGWEATLRIPHPQEKAIVLASYLLPRTSPEGEASTYLGRVRNELTKLGAPAVAELQQLLRTAQADDNLDEAVLVLYDLGSVAQPCVPLLLALLDRPEQVHPVRIFEALGRIGDASIAPRIRPYLEHRDLVVRAAVAGALANFGYQDAADDIAGAVPENPTEGEAYAVYSMLRALKELDPVRASDLAGRFQQAPAMKHIDSLLRGLANP